MKQTNNIPQGYKDSPLGVIPKEWEVKKLGELVDIISGESPNSFNLSNCGKYPYIKVEDMNNCEKYQIHSRYYSNDDRSIVKRNSVIFPKRGAAILNNKVRIAKVEVQMDSNMMAVAVVDQKMYHEFLYFKIVDEKLFRIADTSTIPQINNKHILPYKISLPPLVDQRKISEILSVWDEAIEKQTQLITQFETRKRGLMQQLLTGKKRLKGFGGKWDVVELRKIFHEILDSNDSNSHMVMTISARQGLISQKDKFDRIIAGESLGRYTLIQEGDFAYNKGNSNLYEMGCVYQLENISSALVPFVYICFRPTDRIFPQFYKHWFANHGLDRQLKKIITSGARGDGLLNVNKEDFFALLLPHPSIEEQAFIANILSTADNEIDLAREKLAILKKQEKGLMQQLLTGRKRVKTKE